MADLTSREAKLLEPFLEALIALAEGRRIPQTDAQRLFLECARGLRKPVTPYEIAFLNWQTRKNLDPITGLGVAKDDATNVSIKKKRKKRKINSSMSAAQAKKSSGCRWSVDEIEAHHKKSGYHKQKIVVCRGGGVNPR